MKPIQSLIQKAHDKGLLRYAPPNLVWDDTVSQYQFELARTSMSGVEFGYDFDRDLITWAIQSIDGVELSVQHFFDELLAKTSDFDRSASEIKPDRAVGVEEKQETEARRTFNLADGNTLAVVLTDEGIIVDAYTQHEHVGTEARLASDWWDALTTDLPQFKGDWDDQPCQHYAQTRAIVDEEPEVTAHNDDTIPCSSCGEPVFDDDENAHTETRKIPCEEERTWVVTQVTAVKAADKYQAIDRVNEMHGSSGLISQEAEPRLERWRVGHESYFWAENREHAIEQYLDMMNYENGNPNFVEIVSYE